MAQIKWTLQAADDLEAITEFIALDSGYYATLFALDIFAAIEKLEQFPKLGRIVPETQDPDVREVLFGNYRIIYRLRPGLIEIISIYHGARLLDPSRLK
ncbi:MAG TPA: type II toxin-antitoxin system RelE/ParE family toxin [Flavisolibacter sp.]|nr:type II toxin-antitoxin system RelE/ParE family toxin [Flavisolibacter sp.]